MTYNGWILIPTGGHWNFVAWSDDGSKLYIDNVLVVDNDHTPGKREYLSPIQLEAGMHRLRLEYFERNQGAMLEFKWFGPDHTTSDVVPEEHLYVDCALKPPSLDPVIRPQPAISDCTYENGLYADYYYLTTPTTHPDFSSLTPFVSNVVYDNIDFNWGANEILATYEKDEVGVVFRGYIYLPEAGSWRFGFRGDDGAVMFIDDE